MTPYQSVKTVRRYVHSFRHNTGIGRTGGQKCYNNIALCMLRMLTRDKIVTRSIGHVAPPEWVSCAAGGRPSRRGRRRQFPLQYLVALFHCNRCIASFSLRMWVTTVLYHCHADAFCHHPFFLMCVYICMYPSTASLSCAQTVLWQAYRTCRTAR